jgi:hypothetical protein
MNLHDRIRAVLDQHTRTSTTCTCGRWRRNTYNEHLREMVLAALLPVGEHTVVEGKLQVTRTSFLGTVTVPERSSVGR